LKRDCRRLLFSPVGEGMSGGRELPCKAVDVRKHGLNSVAGARGSLDDNADGDSDKMLNAWLFLKQPARAITAATRHHDDNEGFFILFD